MGIAVDMMRAKQAGATAARAGLSRGSCPYSPAEDAPARDRALFGLWMSGYRSVTPTPVTYDTEEA